MTAGESVLLGSVLFCFACAVWRLLTARPDEPAIYQASRPTVIQFPATSPAYLRDVETDPLWDTGLVGFIRHAGPDGHLLYYAAKTKATIAAVRGNRDPKLVDKAFHYARMTASLAFALHPELRDPASRVVPIHEPVPVFRSRERVH